MANLMYTQELKSTFRLFSSRSYFPFYSDYIQSEQSNYFIKPKTKIFELFHRKKAKGSAKENEKSRLWFILSNLILTKSSLDIAKKYLIYLARKIKKKMRYVAIKYSIPLRDVIKDYLFLCNSRIQIQQCNKVLETYTLGNGPNNELKTLFLSNLLPNISKTQKVTMRVVRGGNGDDETRLYFQTSLFFYDPIKEEKKKQTIRTPLIRIMEIDYKMQKIMKNLLIERNIRLGKNTNPGVNTNTHKSQIKPLTRKSEVELSSNSKSIPYSKSVTKNQTRSRNKLERKMARVASASILPRKEVMDIKLIKNGSLTMRKQNSPFKTRNHSVEMVIDPSLLIHHRDLYYLK